MQELWMYISGDFVKRLKRIQAIQNMSIRNGEWVIISGVKKYFKKNIFRSMKFRIILLVALAGIVPVLIMRGVFLTSYEKRAVEVRTAEIQNQCTILSNQLSSSGYLTGDTSETIRTELVQLSNIYSGRVMVIDGNFKIQEDTYEMDEGKTIVSGNVIRCFKEKGTSEYNKKNRYIEVTAPILGKDDSIVGVLLVSAPTDSVLDSLEILRNKADVVALASILVILMIAVLSGMAMLKPLNALQNPFLRLQKAMTMITFMRIRTQRQWNYRKRSIRCRDA